MPILTQAIFPGQDCKMRTSMRKVLGNELGRIVAAVGGLVLLGANPAGAGEATERSEHDPIAKLQEPCTEESAKIAKKRQAKITRQLKASCKQLDRLAIELENDGKLDLASEVQKMRARLESKILVALAPIAGRYVRVELAGAERVLSLAEVEVFSGGENIAPEGRATQSSTYNHISNPSAEKANDGNNNGDFGVRSTTHTNGETDPWWELDLGIDKGLYKIVIWNRLGESVRSQLDGFKLSVLDGDREVVWERTYHKAPRRKLAIELSSAPGR